LPTSLDELRTTTLRSFEAFDKDIQVISVTASALKAKQDRGSRPASHELTSACNKIIELAGELPAGALAWQGKVLLQLSTDENRG
jgi:hypothetical protein